MKKTYWYEGMKCASEVDMFVKDFIGFGMGVRCMCIFIDMLM